MRKSDMPTRLEHLVGESLQQYAKTGKVEFFTAKFHHPSSVASIIATLMVVIWVIVFIAIFVTITDSEYIPDEIRQYLPYFLLLVLVVLVATVIAVATNREVGKITLQNRTVTIELHTRSHRPPALFTYCLNEVAVKNKLHRNSNATRSFFTLRIVQSKKSTTFSVDATGKYFEYLALIAVLRHIQTHPPTSCS